MSAETGAAISVQSASDVDITNNTVFGWCGSGIDVGGTSSSVAIENNVLQSTSDSASVFDCSSVGPAVAGLEVDATAAAQTTANYNIVDVGIIAPSTTLQPAYLWSGTSYSSATALTAATGQGKADFNTQVLDRGGAIMEGSVAIDSADSSAPGELLTDISGRSRAATNDPHVPDTGSGTYSDYDRGAFEALDSVTLNAGPYMSLTPNLGNNTVPAGVALPFGAVASDTWHLPINYVFNFTDGTTESSTTGTVTHTFATTGTYAYSVSVSTADSLTSEAGSDVKVIPYIPTSMVFSLSETAGYVLTANANAMTDSWPIYSVQFSWGDGTSSPLMYYSPWVASHQYAAPGKYTVTMTVSDDSERDTVTTLVVYVGGGDYSLGCAHFDRTTPPVGDYALTPNPITPATCANGAELSALTIAPTTHQIRELAPRLERAVGGRTR